MIWKGFEGEEIKHVSELVADCRGVGGDRGSFNIHPATYGLIEISG